MKIEASELMMKTFEFKNPEEKVHFQALQALFELFMAGELDADLEKVLFTELADKPLWASVFEKSVENTNLITPNTWAHRIGIDDETNLNVGTLLAQTQELECLGTSLVDGSMRDLNADVLAATLSSLSVKQQEEWFDDVSSMLESRPWVQSTLKDLGLEAERVLIEDRSENRSALQRAMHQIKTEKRFQSEASNAMQVVQPSLEKPWFDRFIGVFSLGFGAVCIALCVFTLSFVEEGKENHDSSAFALRHDEHELPQKDEVAYQDFDEESLFAVVNDDHTWIESVETDTNDTMIFETGEHHLKVIWVQEGQG